MKRGRVLIVDDDASIRASLREAIEESGIEVCTADSGEQALSLLTARAPDLVLSDVRMGGMSGIELLRLLRERKAGVDVVLMTAYDDMATVVEAMREGAVEFLVKPFELEALLALLERVLDDRRSRARAAAAAGAAMDAPALQHPEGQPLIGRDPRMIGVYKRIGQSAASRASVLIRGESGTGKELIARAIHANSKDPAAPFVAVNCAALPATLLESELFGHVRGSFTGATNDRKGRFALAGRGTLFLDEVGDMPAELQAKLLRVLQEREFYAVGAERPERTEARVLSASHRDLEAMIGRGEFRADLYYRLRVLEIVLPPLRERPGDIALLAGEFVQRAARSSGRRPPVLSGEALAVLATHNWPGNVRELENALERAVTLASGDVIRREHIEVGPPTQGEALLGSLESVEKLHIERVLSATGGQKMRAAAILGVSRPRLDRLLQKHGLA
jgi:two-component system, NtrC family, response regulator AtoC